MDAVTVLGFIVALIIVLPGAVGMSFVCAGAIKEGGLTLLKSRQEELIVAAGQGLAYIVFALVVFAAIALVAVTVVRTIS